jgi:hypothetical protein
LEWEAIFAEHFEMQKNELDMKKALKHAERQHMGNRKIFMIL